MICTGPVVGSTQPLTETSKDGRSLWLTTLLPLYAECVEILGSLPSYSRKGRSRPVLRFIYLWSFTVKTTAMFLVTAMRLALL